MALDFQILILSKDVADSSIGGRAQSAWKMSYLCKSIHCDLLSSYSICKAVVQQVCSLQGHKSTHIDILLHPSSSLSGKV